MKSMIFIVKQKMSVENDFKIRLRDYETLIIMKSYPLRLKIMFNEYKELLLIFQGMWLKLH